MNEPPTSQSPQHPPVSVPAKRSRLSRLLHNRLFLVTFVATVFITLIFFVVIPIVGFLGIAIGLGIGGSQNISVTTETPDDNNTEIIDPNEESRAQGQSKTGKKVGELFPGVGEHTQERYGLRLHRSDERDLSVDALTEADFTAPFIVVLVHGLDEPGQVWYSLVPMLLDSGFTVLEFDYPNDQAVVPSAELLAQHLAQLKTLGVHDVSLVSHSMGGLVCREMLTSPTLYNGDGSDHAIYPNVIRLSMAGTPNHGSELAVLQGLSDVREQVLRVYRKEGLLWDGFFDGGGEAKDDLLPDSEFITALNNRPLATHVEYTIIAGRATPVTVESGKSLWDSILGKNEDENEDTDQSENAEDVAQEEDGHTGILAQIQSLSDKLGDGCVSVNSTRLKGVEDHTIVSGNHVTIIHSVNLFVFDNPDGETPPGATIILDRLIEDRKRMNNNHEQNQ